MNKNIFRALADLGKDLSEEELTITKQLSKLKKGRLFIKARKNPDRLDLYYHPSANILSTYRYVSKRSKIAQELAQRQYLELKQAELAKMKTELETFADKLTVYSTDAAYASLPAPVQELVKKAEPDDEEFLAVWVADMGKRTNPREVSGTIRTEKGEPVRSKSEKIIADKFGREGIPYVYEPVIGLKTGRQFYPDFGVLNLRTRKTFYFEHFGMMDNGDYVDRTMEKLRDYNSNGFWFGENLIYTMESSGKMFSEDELERIIEKYLK